MTKIDTQAPGRMHIAFWKGKAPHFVGPGVVDAVEYIRADLADARAAAAAQAMREAAALAACRAAYQRISAVNDADAPLSRTAMEGLADEVAEAVEALPVDAAALDRLIAERVREAFEEAADHIREYAVNIVDDWARHVLGFAADSLDDAARGSKEGQS